MIDVTKCMGCRRGISTFTKENNYYSHLDLFATAEAGSIYRCENSNIIGSLLVQNESKTNIYIPNAELDAFFDAQAFWWEDIVSLAYYLLKTQEGVSAFFNEGEEGNKMRNKPNLEMENALLLIAEREEITVDEEAYPDLYKWKQPNTNL